MNPTSLPSGADPDAALLTRIAARDTKAFSELMSRHLDRIVAFAERMLGSKSDAEDVAQEVFLKAWQWAGRWQPGQARFSTWLHTVALNACRQRWRKHKADYCELDEELETPAPGPYQIAEANSQADRVRLALAALPERQRAAIILSHYHGMGNIEAAQVLDVSVEAIESLLGRARRQLRISLIKERRENQDD